MIKYIEKQANSINVLLAGGRNYLIPLNELCQIRKLNAECSDWILQISEKTGYKSDLMRNEILLPLARIIKDKCPSKIDWFSTFKQVEENLYESATSKDGKWDILDDIDGALSDDIKDEIDNPQTDEFIKNYLKEWNLQS